MANHGLVKPYEMHSKPWARGGTQNPWTSCICRHTSLHYGGRL